MIRVSLSDVNWEPRIGIVVLLETGWRAARRGSQVLLLQPLNTGRTLKTDPYRVSRYVP